MQMIAEERDHPRTVARTPRVVLHLEPFDPETPTKMYHPRVWRPVDLQLIQLYCY